jgi:hypothetical protein
MLYHVYAIPSGGDDLDTMLVSTNELSFDDAYHAAEIVLENGIPLKYGGNAVASYVRVDCDAGTLCELFNEAE